MCGWAWKKTGVRMVPASKMPHLFVLPVVVLCRYILYSIRWASSGWASAGWASAGCPTLGTDEIRLVDIGNELQRDPPPLRLVVGQTSNLRCFAEPCPVNTVQDDLLVEQAVEEVARHIRLGVVKVRYPRALPHRGAHAVYSGFGMVEYVWSNQPFQGLLA
jgi:hypothetical protein